MLSTAVWMSMNRNIVEKMVVHRSLVKGNIILMNVLCPVSFSLMYTDTLKIFEDIRVRMDK
jgi:hypothetical protein